MRLSTGAAAACFLLTVSIANAADDLHKLQGAVENLQTQVTSVQGQITGSAKSLSDVQADVANVTATVKDLRADTTQLKAMLATLLARSEGEAAAMNYSGADGTKRAAKDATASAATVAAIDPSGNKEDALGHDLKVQVDDCVNQAKSTASAYGTGTSVSTVTSTCKDASQILDKINQRLGDIEKDYEDCRNKLIGTGQINPDSLAMDIRGLSLGSAEDIKKNMAAAQGLLSNTAGDVQNCANKIQKDVDNIRSLMQSQADMGSVLAFIGQACFAAGGNPYVCAGFIVLAMLTNIGKGGGDGGSAAGGPQGHGDGSGQYSLPQRNVPPGDDPARGTGSGGTFGVNRAGSIACRVASGGTLACWDVRNPSRSVLISPDSLYDPGLTENTDGASELRSLVTGNHPEAIAFCPDGTQKHLLGGFVMRLSSNYRPAQLDYAGPQARISFGQKQALGVNSLESLCP